MWDGAFTGEEIFYVFNASIFFSLGFIINTLI